MGTISISERLTAAATIGSNGNRGLTLRTSGMASRCTLRAVTGGSCVRMNEIDPNGSRRLSWCINEDHQTIFLFLLQNAYHLFCYWGFAFINGSAFQCGTRFYACFYVCPWKRISRYSHIKAHYLFTLYF